MNFERPTLDDPTPFARRDLRSPMVRETRGGGLGGVDYKLRITPVERIIAESGAVTRTTLGDEVVDQVSSATAVTDYKIDFGIGLEALTELLTFSSSDKLVATIDEQGNVTHVSDGEVVIIAESAANQTRIEISLTMTTNSGVPVNNFVFFVDGSLRQRLTAQVDTRIAGKNAAVAKHIYTSFPSNSEYTDSGEIRGGTNEFIRNSDFWAADVSNITCISPSHVRSGQTIHRRSPTGTLISPYHFVTANHFSVSVGSTLHFVGSDNTLYGADVLGYSRIGTTDLRIGVLSDALPAAVESAKVFPNSVYNQLYGNYLYRVPALLLDQQEHGMIHTVSTSLRFESFKIPAFNSKYYPYVDQFSDNRVWNSAGLELYDSGNPAFVIHNDKLIILTVWFSGGGGSGSSITKNSPAIQSAMDTLSTQFNKPQQNLTYAIL